MWEDDWQPPIPPGGYGFRVTFRGRSNTWMTLRYRDCERPAEIARRAPALGKKEPNRAIGSAEATARVPEGKANLIRASFKAGLTPPAIARTVGMPLALVRRVLKSKDL